MPAPIIIATNVGLQIWEDNPEFQASANSITQKYNIVGAQGLTWTRSALPSSIMRRSATHLRGQSTRGPAGP